MTPHSLEDPLDRAIASLREWIYRERLALDTYADFVESLERVARRRADDLDEDPEPLYPAAI